MRSDVLAGRTELGSLFRRLQEDQGQSHSEEKLRIEETET